MPRNPLRRKVQDQGFLERHFDTQKIKTFPWKVKCHKLLDHGCAIFAFGSQNWSWTTQTLERIRRWETKTMTRLFQFKKTQGWYMSWLPYENVQYGQRDMAQNGIALPAWKNYRKILDAPWDVSHLVKCCVEPRKNKTKKTCWWRFLILVSLLQRVSPKLSLPLGSAWFLWQICQYRSQFESKIRFDLQTKIEPELQYCIFRSDCKLSCQRLVQKVHFFGFFWNRGNGCSRQKDWFASPLGDGREQKNCPISTILKLLGSIVWITSGLQTISQIVPHILATSFLSPFMGLQFCDRRLSKNFLFIQLTWCSGFHRNSLINWQFCNHIRHCSVKTELIDRDDHLESNSIFSVLPFKWIVVFLLLCFLLVFTPRGWYIGMSDDRNLWNSAVLSQPFDSKIYLVCHRKFRIWRTTWWTKSFKSSDLHLELIQRTSHVAFEGLARMALWISSDTLPFPVCPPVHVSFVWIHMYAVHLPSHGSVSENLSVNWVRFKRSVIHEDFPEFFQCVLSLGLCSCSTRHLWSLFHLMFPAFPHVYNFGTLCFDKLSD